MGWRYNCPNVYVKGGIWTTIEHDPPFEKGPNMSKKIFGKFWGKPEYVWGID